MQEDTETAPGNMPGRQQSVSKLPGAALFASHQRTKRSLTIIDPLTRVSMTSSLNKEAISPYG